MATMKNVIVKTIVFIGFLVVLLGLIIDPLIVQASTPAEEAAVSAPLVITALFIAFPFFFVYLILSVIFGMVFIFSKNETLANVGYALGAFAGAFGVMILIDSKTFSLILIPIGLICMMVGAALKGILVIIGFFGFVKPDGKQAIVTIPVSGAIARCNSSTPSSISASAVSTCGKNILPCVDSAMFRPLLINSSASSSRSSACMAWLRLD